jgi:hypothetical protein
LTTKNEVGNEKLNDAHLGTVRENLLVYLVGGAENSS